MIEMMFFNDIIYKNRCTEFFLRLENYLLKIFVI